MHSSHQAALSPEAEAYLARTKPIAVPLPLWRPVGWLIRTLVARDERTMADAAIADTGVTQSARRLADVDLTLLEPSSSSEDTYAVYIHGGAFVVGNPIDNTAVRIADAAGLDLYAIDYDLSPGSRFPRALEQCVAVWDALGRERPGRRVLVGISAGGNLALALLGVLLERKILGEEDALPAAVVALTPWTDLTDSGESHRFNDGRDPVLVWKNQLDKSARAYVGTADVNNPRVSPVHQDWTGLTCPVLITTGTRDLLLSDCERAFDAMESVGAPVEIDVAEGLWHAYSDTDLPEARALFERIAAFIARSTQGVQT